MVRSIAIASATLLLAAGLAHAVAVRSPGGPHDARRASAARVVSAALSTDEIALALVRPSALAAVSVFADDAAVSNVLGPARQVRGRVPASPEALVALEPTLVLSDPFGHMHSAPLTARLGIRILRTRLARTFDDVEANILAVGDALGRRDAAQRMAGDLRARRASLAARVAGRPRPRVLLYGRGNAAGTGTLQDHILTLAGGANAAAEVGLEGHGPLTVERVLALDPDVVVTTAYTADGGARSLRAAPADLEHPLWRHLRARRTGRVIALPARTMLSTSQHAMRAAEDLARALHPEAFRGLESHP